jgi:hypothetical protein
MSHLLRQILAMTQQNHLNTTSKIAPDWDWIAFEKKRTGKNGTLDTHLFHFPVVVFIIVNTHYD